MSTSKMVLSVVLISILSLVFAIMLNNVNTAWLCGWIGATLTSTVVSYKWNRIN